MNWENNSGREEEKNGITLSSIAALFNQKFAVLKEELKCMMVMSSAKQDGSQTGETPQPLSNNNKEKTVEMANEYLTSND
jgi:hypothetical protein